LFDRPGGGGRALLAHIEFRQEDAHEELEEFRELAHAAGVVCVECITGKRRVPDPKFFVGGGKAEEIRAAIERTETELVIFNHALSPAQERNLEQFLHCRVLDRIGLILDIFAQRARTFEGKLQVELAQLKHISTRLVRGWTHLERQKGGIGLRGPGEKQLETDRRLVSDRMRWIDRRLGQVSRRRDLSRRARRKAAVPVASLVGYTNAGKSTLFNRLTGANGLVADKLFATLDPTLRRIPLPGSGPAVLVDTVGFIRHLPHELVAAFRATLEETRESHLLLHVIDASAPERGGNTTQVNQVLKEIGAAELPQIEVFNKIDRVDGRLPEVERDENGRVRRLWLSAATGEGVEELRQAMAERLGAATIHRRIRLSPAAGRLRARLFQLAAVLGEHAEANGDCVLEVEISPRRLEQLCRDEGLDRACIAA